MNTGPGSRFALRLAQGDLERCRNVGAYELASLLGADGPAPAFAPERSRGAAARSRPPALPSDWRPITLDAGDLAKSVTGDPATLRFSIDGVPFKPYFETYGRNSVYLHLTMT